MIDYMETGAVSLSKFPSNMGMSNNYNMGSPVCSIDSPADMNHCDNFNHTMRPRTSTSTTEFILKEISSTSGDTVFTNTQDLINIHGRMSNFPSSTGALTNMTMSNAPYIQPNCNMVSHNIPQMFRSDEINSNTNGFSSIVPVSSTNQGLLDSSYLQSSPEHKTLSLESGSYDSNEPSNSFGALGKDPFSFSSGNINDCFESNPPSISSSVCLSDGLDLKEEAPQIVPQCPSTSSVTPIDMEHQEVIKTERKRQRNRVAASKCRKRKLERIARLEDKVNSLKNQNIELTSSANTLRQQVAELKSKVISHVNSGCHLMLGHQQQLNFPFESPPVM